MRWYPMAPNFRDHLIAASLKRGVVVFWSVRSTYFRDHLIAASLKRSGNHDRSIRVGQFPRSSDRGLIEAQVSAWGCRVRVHFRDHLIAASLKPYEEQ